MAQSFASTAIAFRLARLRATAAQDVEAGLLHTAIVDAHDEGLSIRDTARMLNVPKSTVARHWRGTCSCVIRDAPPSPWYDEHEYVEAHNFAWSHDLSEQILTGPWSVEDHPDGGRTYRMQAVRYVRDGD